MEMRAYAKINLYLDVMAKRSDGYHDILSLMQTVDLHDVVRLDVQEDAPGEIVLHCGAGLPCDEKNLAYRAALAYFKGNIPCKLEINVQKNIPQQAGLAGGSADCAAVLRLLNQRFDRYSESELLMLGAGLGADVPFCLAGGTVITRGIGELMQPCAAMPDCYLVIARGGAGVSTPQAYRDLDAAYGDFAMQKKDSEARLACVIDAMERGDVYAMCDAAYNIFESVVLPVHDVARALKHDMQENGAIGALMSGSGPSVVGIFDSEQLAQTVCRNINEKGIVAYVCKPVNQI